MKRSAVLVSLALLLSACGGGGSEPKVENASAPDATSTTMTEAETKRLIDQAEQAMIDARRRNTTTTTTATAKGGGSGATSTTVPSAQNAAQPPPTAKLARSCVRKGASGDEQTLTVRTAPEDMVGYTSEYSDQSTAFAKPEYKTGDGQGLADTAGVYTATWLVPPTAPEGKVKLHWVARGKFQTPLEFTVVSPTGSC